MTAMGRCGQAARSLAITGHDKTRLCTHHYGAQAAAHGTRWHTRTGSPTQRKRVARYTKPDMQQCRRRRSPQPLHIRRSSTAPRYGAQPLDTHGPWPGNSPVETGGGASEASKWRIFSMKHRTLIAGATCRVPVTRRLPPLDYKREGTCNTKTQAHSWHS